MHRFIIRRLLQSIPILFGISIIVFAMMRLAPGDPFSHLMTPGIDVEALKRRVCELGYCQPFYIQYFVWLKDLMMGNLGYSIRYGRPIAEMMAERLGPTFALVATAEVFALAIAIPLGVISALRQYSIFDYSLNAMAFAGISTPSFFMALVAIYLFGVTWRIFPLPLQDVAQTALEGGYNFLDRIPYMILPMLIVAVRSISSYSRFMRSSMLEVIRQDYVRTARAKGLAERVVVYKHALRNALLPVITLLGLSIPGLFGGSLIIETIFSWPGMGQMAFAAVNNRDYPVIMAVNLFAALLVLLGNLIADVLYALVDPRIRYA